MLVLLLIMLVSMTGCSNNKTLKCTATNSEDNRNTTSNLEVTFKDEKLEDMTLSLDIELPAEEQSYKQSMMYQLRQKTNQVYSTQKGIKAVFGMDSTYFDSLGVTKDAKYGELKQVLELQGYTCEE